MKEKEKLHPLDSVDQRLGPPQDGGGALVLKSETGNRALENIPRPKAREENGFGAILAPPPLTVPSGPGRKRGRGREDREVSEHIPSELDAAVFQLWG